MNDGRQLRILLAEDSGDNVLIIRLYLKNYPYVIDVAENGEEAVRFFGENEYDLVLMDIQMPGMDGYEATERIRAMEAERGLGRTPIIAVTAHASEEIRRRVLDCGGDAYITKPVPKARLLEAIQSVVSA
ncbi:response regulator [Paucidesulfovibrio longus]|uniref:response regulator n=1 Tax=Paucidesulfovibrio longus TaxID=889 RepID=UPI0006888EE6|nr:response regulator [Paucidesulfovibrio longus]